MDIAHRPRTSSAKLVLSPNSPFHNQSGDTARRTPRIACHFQRVCLAIQPAERIAGTLVQESGDVGAIGQHVGGDVGDVVGKRPVSRHALLSPKLKRRDTSGVSLPLARAKTVDIWRLREACRRCAVPLRDEDIEAAFERQEVHVWRVQTIESFQIAVARHRYTFGQGSAKRSRAL